MLYVPVNHFQSCQDDFLSCTSTKPCGDPESFVRGGPNLITFFFFLVDEDIEDPNTAIDGPTSARQQNAI